MIPWLQIWPKVRDYYYKRLLEAKALERLAIEYGLKLRPKK